MTIADDPFADFDDEKTSAAPATPAAASSFSGSGSGSGGSSGFSGRDDSGHFAEEIYSKKISGRLRTFFIDLKQSGNGKFIKISEKSRGKKSTVMFDAEDLEAFIDAFTQIKARL